MKRFLSIFLTLVMLFSVCPSIFAAEGDEVEYSTDGGSSWTTASFDEAWTAVSKANTTAEIKILKNIEISQTKEVWADATGTANITLTAAGNVTVTRGTGLTSDPVFKVKANGQKGGATLTLGKEGGMGDGNALIFDGGNAEASYSYFFIDYSSAKHGTLNMYDGVTIQNAVKTTGDSNATGGAAVYVNGEFNMYGGMIQNCALKKVSSGAMEDGGAVCVSRFFNMYDGTITNCTSVSNGGAVAVLGYDHAAVFNMSGGTITVNATEDFMGRGGGIVLGNDTQSAYGGTLNLTGGTVTGNIADGGFAKGKDIAVMNSGSTLNIEKSIGNDAEIFLDKYAIHVNAALNSADVMTLKTSANPADDTVLVNFTNSVKASEHLPNFTAVDYQGNSVSITANEDDNAIIVGTPPAIDYEVEYKIGDGDWTGSTLTDAVTAIGNNAGEIRLLKNIDTTAEITIPGTVTLDLCGFTIDAGGTHRIFTVNGSLTLNDSSEDGTGNITGGKVTSSKTYNVDGGAAILLGGNTSGDNTAEFIMNGGRFTNNIVDETGSGLGLGGAILANSGTSVTIHKGTFENNQAGSMGGAIAGDSVVNFDIKDAVFKQNEVTNGNMVGGGGAVYIQSNENTATLTNCIFDGNREYAKTYGGGAVSGQYLEIEIVGCTFTNNEVWVNEGEDAKNARGGAICVMDSIYTIKNSSFIGNKSAHYGGAIATVSQGANPQLILENCWFTDNKAATMGDDVQNNTGNATVTLNTSYTDADGMEYVCKWYYDGAKDGAAAPRYSEENANEKTTLTESNEKCGLKAIYTEAADPEVEYSYMGAYPNHTTTFTEQGTLKEALKAFESASSINYIMLLKDVEIDQTIPMDNAWTLKAKDGETFTLKRAAGFTGPMIESAKNSPLIGTANGTLILDGGNVENAEPMIVAQGNSMTLKNVTLQNNTSNQDGSAINANTGLSLDGVTIKNCSTSGYGTVYFSMGSGNAKTVEFTNTTFENNTALGGSAIYYDRGSGNMVSLKVHDGCVFKDNKPYSTTTDAENIAEAIKRNNLIYIDYLKDDTSTAGIFDGTCTFTGNTTKSGLNLAPEIGTLTSSAQKALEMTTFKLAEGSDKVKVVVGAYATNGTTKKHVMNIGFDNSNAANYFELVAADFDGGYDPVQTGYKLVVDPMVSSSYLVVGRDFPQKIYSNIDGQSADLDTYNDGTATLYTQYGTAFKQCDVVLSGLDDMTSMAYAPVAVPSDTVTLAVTTKSGYAFKSAAIKEKNSGITIEPSSHTSNLGIDTFTFTMPNAEVEIDITFEKLGNKVTVEQPENGTVTVTGATDLDLVTEGTELTVDAVPNAYYELESITVIKTGDPNTKVTLTGNTFTMPDYPITVSAAFKKLQYNVTSEINGDPNSAAISGLAAKYEWGAEVSFTVTAAEYYTVSAVAADGDTVTVLDNGSGSYSFTMPQEDVKIIVSTAKAKYTVSAAETTNGSITLPAETSVAWGETVTFTVTADQYYEISEVTVNHGAVAVTPGENGSYSFTMPQGNAEISAAFTRPSFTVTFETNGGNVIDSQTVSNGDKITKPDAPAKTNYGFAGWYKDRAFTDKYDFAQPVTGEVKLYARWFLWGDVNGDGIADSVDALVIRRWFAKLIPEPECYYAAYVSGLDKDQPDAVDGLLIKRHLANLITQYPVEISAEGYEFDLENDTYYAPQQ